MRTTEQAVRKVITAKEVFVGIDVHKESWHVTVRSDGEERFNREALDFAIQHGIPHGGWIPKGRRAEDGPLAERYQLKEIPTTSYPKRTQRNVIDSSGTLIISHGALTGGSVNTVAMAAKHNKRWLHLDMQKLNLEQAAQALRSWISENRSTCLMYQVRAVEGFNGIGDHS